MTKLLIAADVILAALFALKFRTIPEQIPLFYSRPWGEAQIVDYWYIFFLPLFMHLFFFLNIFLSKKLFGSEHIPQKIFDIANIVVIVLFSTVFIKILFLIS